MTITTKRNAQDFTGLLMLKRYRNVPEVRAHAYLYIHDTTTVVENFPSHGRMHVGAVAMNFISLSSHSLRNRNLVHESFKIVERRFCCRLISVESMLIR